MSGREESREDSDKKSTSKKGEKKEIKPGDQIVALWLKEDDDWRVAEVHCPALLFPVAISHCAIVCEASSKAVVWKRAHPMAGPESVAFGKSVVAGVRGPAALKRKRDCFGEIVEAQHRCCSLRGGHATPGASYVQHSVCAGPLREGTERWEQNVLRALE